MVNEMKRVHESNGLLHFACIAPRVNIRIGDGGRRTENCVILWVCVPGCLATNYILCFVDAVAAVAAWTT